MKTYWAVVDLSETLPQVPVRVCRWRWYARYLTWFMNAREDGESLVVMPWTTGNSINTD